MGTYNRKYGVRSVMDGFLRIFQNFSEQLCQGAIVFSCIGTLEESNGLLKDLIRTALSLVIHNICRICNICNFLTPPEGFDLVCRY